MTSQLHLFSKQSRQLVSRNKNSRKHWQHRRKWQPRSKTLLLPRNKEDYARSFTIIQHNTCMIIINIFLGAGLMYLTYGGAKCSDNSTRNISFLKLQVSPCALVVLKTGRFQWLSFSLFLVCSNNNQRSGFFFTFSPRLPNKKERKSARSLLTQAKSHARHREEDCFYSWAVVLSKFLVKSSLWV